MAEFVFEKAFKLAICLLIACSGFGLAQSGLVQPCVPPVTKVRFGRTPDVAVSEKMRELYHEDQSARAKPVSEIDWSALSVMDRQHQREVLGFLRKGKLGSATDYYYAALIMQHGSCPAHYKLANRLAQQAIDSGDETEDTRWLYAATLDRYLRSVGKPQKFGTQYLSQGNSCEYKLEPVDPRTTDAERAEYGVPYLRTAKTKATALSAECRAGKE